MESLLAKLPPFYARKIAETEAAEGQVRPVVKVTCHDPVRNGQQIVQQMVRHSLGKRLEMIAKRNCVLVHCGSVDQAAYANGATCTHQGATVGRQVVHGPNDPLRQQKIAR